MFKKFLFLCLPFLFVMNFPQHSLSFALYAKHRKVDGKQIIQAIKQGEGVMLDSCIIVGPVRMDEGNEYPDTVRSFVLITRSSFQDSVMFNQCIFLQPVSFRGCVFGDDVYFWRISFQVNTTFDDVVFEKEVTFDSTVFNGFTDFENANFRGTARFSNSTFDSMTSYNMINYSMASFSSASFEKPALFFDNSFNVYTRFIDAFFNSTGNFYRSKFKAQTSFTGARFREDIILTDAEFSNEVSFTWVEFKNFYVRWSQIKDFIRADYLFLSRLIKNFEELRMLDDADAVYLRLRKSETAKIKWYKPTRYWGYLLWVTCGYGVKPERVLLLSLLIILLFTFFYIKSNAIREIQKEFGHRRRRRKYRIVRKDFRKRFSDAFYFSVHTFIIGIVSDWYPTEEFLIKTKKIKLLRFRTLSMIEGSLGWTLLVLFVVTLTRKFIR